MSSHYNPNQPRVPAGREGAGQWSDGESASASILNSPLLDRDRLIKAALGIRDNEKRDGNVRLAFNSETSTEPLQLRSTRVPPKVTPPRGGGGIGILLSLLFSQLSELNSDKQRTIVVFRRGKYRDESDNGFDLNGLGILRSPEEVKKYCGDDFKKIQDIVDKAYDDAKEKWPNASPSDLGSKVHELVEDRINDLRDPNNKDLKDPRFNAELTYEENPPGDPNRVETRGAKRSIRVDVHYKPNKETLCVPEIKTGDKVLPFDRMLDIIDRAAARPINKDVQQILVTEMRPKNAPPGKKMRVPKR